MGRMSRLNRIRGFQKLQKIGFPLASSGYSRTDFPGLQKVSYAGFSPITQCPRWCSSFLSNSQWQFLISCKKSRLNYLSSYRVWDDEQIYRPRSPLAHLTLGVPPTGEVYGHGQKSSGRISLFKAINNVENLVSQVAAVVKFKPILEYPTFSSIFLIVILLFNAIINNQCQPSWGSSMGVPNCSRWWGTTSSQSGNY